MTIGGDASLFWTPLLTLASWVIVEMAAVLSHASTIAREYGLP